MAQVPRDSYRPLHAPHAIKPGPAPLRFGVGEARTAESGQDALYRAPQASRWRVLRAPALFALVCGGLIVATWVAWAPFLDALAEGTAALAVREGDGVTQPIATVVFIGVAALGFVLAWWSVTHPRRAVRLSDDRGTMPVDAIAGQLRAAILETDEVREAEVSVENRGQSRVRVRTWLRVSPEARIDDVLDGVDEAAEWLVYHRLGLLLSEPPLAEVKYDELDLRAGRSHSSERCAQEYALQPRPHGEDDEDA